MCGAVRNLTFAFKDTSFKATFKDYKEIGGLEALCGVQPNEDPHTVAVKTYHLSRRAQLQRPSAVRAVALNFKGRVSRRAQLINRAVVLNFDQL